jgi:TrmH family RNA methyltransferase
MERFPEGTERVTSIKDRRVELARQVRSRSGREGSGRVLLEGLEAINWAFAGAWKVEYILVEEKSVDILSQLSTQPEAVYLASSGILKKITETSYLVPIVGVGRQVETSAAKSDFVIVLDNVKDPGNIGTIVRTGNAFGVSEYLAANQDFDPYYRKTIEASRGLVFRSHFRNLGDPVSTKEHLRNEGFQIVTTSPHGSTIQALVELDDRPIALVIGNETVGVSAELVRAADKTILIPMNGSVESLNVGVAAGISIYELKIKRILTMIENQIRATLGRQINVLGRHIRAILDAELKQACPLDSRQVVFLMVLQCDKEMPVNQALRENGLLENELDAFIAPLLQRDLIILKDDKLRVTGETRDFLSKLWAIKDRAEQKILSCLTTDERLMFIDMIEKVSANCEELIASSGQRGVSNGNLR